MQCYNFLQYSNTLLVSRAADLDGTLKKLKDVTYEGNEYLQEEIQTQRNIQVYKVDGDKIYIKEDVVNQLGDQLQPKDVITFGNDPTRYKVKSLKKEIYPFEKYFLKFIGVKVVLKIQIICNYILIQSH